MEFDEFVNAHGAYLLRLATVMTGNSHHAEDLVQTTLLEVYRKWGRIRAVDNQLAYVKRMLVNAQLSWRRRRWTAERPSLIDDSIVTSAPDPAEGIAEREDLKSRLAQLTPRARTVLALKYYADMTDPEIAEVLGLAESTVRSTTSRALRSLRAAEPDLEQTR